MIKSYTNSASTFTNVGTIGFSWTIPNGYKPILAIFGGIPYGGNSTGRTVPVESGKILSPNATSVAFTVGNANPSVAVSAGTATVVITFIRNI